MGKKTKLPPRLRARVRRNKKGEEITYYTYDFGIVDGVRKEKSLGTEYFQALQQWAALERTNIPSHMNPTFPDVAAKYMAEVVPKKAKNTQKNNFYDMKKLLSFFGGENPAPLDQIKPKHISQYLYWRRDVPSAANSEIGLFSHVWNYAREIGMTDKANPCTGVRRHKEKGRKEIYIEEAVYQAVYDCADEQTQYIMEVAYLTGQRPIDVIKLHTSQIGEDMLHFQQQKTKKRVDILLVGRLKEIIDTIKPEHGLLFTNAFGGSLTPWSLRRRFHIARQEAMKKFPDMADKIAEFQFRDLRAKAATDKAILSSNITEAQNQLGHSSPNMTMKYIRKYKPVLPTK